MLRVVCFDLGGVLVKVCRTFNQAVVQAGLPEREAGRLSEAIAVQRRAVVTAQYERGQLSCEQYYQALSEAVDGVYDADEIRQIHHAWTLTEYPGAFELVTTLNARRDVVTACLSNTSHSHWLRLSGADRRDEYPSVARLRIRLASHVLEATKPDPRIFELARQRFECNPEEICFFDDLEENVRGARTAGWLAEHIDHAGDPIAQVRTALKHRGVDV